MNFSKEDFGKKFHWGVATSAYQTEGAHNKDGKRDSIWDVFTNTKGNIHENHHGNHASDFYNRYRLDLAIMKAMHIKNFRMSLAWSRIIPHGDGKINKKGIEFYDRLIDHALALGIQPWVTLYHWDLPYELEKRGGWTNRETLYRFENYTEVCAKAFGDRIEHWMVLNEPMVFTGAGYFLGEHAPGRKGLKNFLPAMHHAALAQAAGGRILRDICPKSDIGSTFSCSLIEPHRPIEKDIEAAKRVDALLNRLFIEPALGLGYPVKEVKILSRVEEYLFPNDEALLPFKFDFIGVQNYTREIVEYSFLTPYLHAKILPANTRGVPTTVMNWEVHDDCLYQMLKKFSAYSKVKKIIVTENGAAFHDVKTAAGYVHDIQRINYLKTHISKVLQAKNEGVKVTGYFIWTFTDNFEWAEGFKPKFGLVHIDFETQERTVKDSGYWYRDFLKKKKKGKK
jgi:beta-glucosidase